MFFDVTLSGSGKMACSSCHDPASHFAPPNDRAVQLGGLDLKQPGLRAVPTLTYGMYTPAFSIGEEDAQSEAEEETPMQEAARMAKRSLGKSKVDAPAPKTVFDHADEEADEHAPRGGLMLDGRVDTLQDQAVLPLMSSFEMANRDPASLAARIRKNYGDKIAQLAGRSVLNDTHALLAEAAFAIARYQVEEQAFHLFSSKYDAYLRGDETLSEAEMRGLKVFEDKDKGNCADCHPNKPAAGLPPLFTDYQYEAIGAPRNAEIPANSDLAYYDLGLCGPLRKDAIAANKAYCGFFKTPTLRNVAERKVFFHNGVYKSLEDVMRFYARRNTDPQLFYPKGKDGKVVAYNDLPSIHRKNVDVKDVPFNRKPGDAPALDDQDIADLVAFLKTLTDR